MVIEVDVGVIGIQVNNNIFLIKMKTYFPFRLAVKKHVKNVNLKQEKNYDIIIIRIQASSLWRNYSQQFVAKYEVHLFSEGNLAHVIWATDDKIRMPPADLSSRPIT